jgi:tetratricopeptide (TPR) repeat protein
MKLAAASSSLLLAAMVALARVAAAAAVPPLPDLAGAEPRVAAKIADLHRALEQKPGDGEAWGRYGMTLDAHRYAQAAAAAYQRATELDPRDFRWWYFLGALQETAAPAEAARSLEAALRLDSAYAPAHIRLARTLEALARRDEALAHYREAIRLAPDDPMGYLGAGRITLATGDTRGAIALLEQARQHGPRIQAVIATLARAYQRAGDNARADALAAEARDLPRMMHHHDPRHAAIGNEAVDRESFLRRAKTSLETGQAARARTQLEELLRLEPTDAEAWLALAGVEDQLGNREQALAAARRALELDPRLPGGHSILANALFQMGRIDEAERAARTALESDPDDARLHVLMSMVAAQRGDIAAVTSHLDTAYAGGAGDRQLRAVMRTLLAELAGALEDVGRRAEAARRWEQVLHLLRLDGASVAERSAVEARIKGLREGAG